MPQDGDTKIAASQIEKQIAKLKVTLEDVLEDRRRNEVAIEAMRKETQRLIKEGSEIATKEGNCRKQIAELQTAMEGLRD